MLTKESGPYGPDHETEPCEVAASTTAPDRLERASESVSLDDTESPATAQSCADPAYESSEDCSGISLRVVFTQGSPSGPLRDWVRHMMLRSTEASAGHDEATG